MASSPDPEQFRGWLMKWTNYIKGYQKRWFVLSDGLLSYYRTQEEMVHMCRGTVNLTGAFIDTMDSTNFVITNGPQVYYLRAKNGMERQRWVTALTLAKAKAIKDLESDGEGEGEMSPDGEGGGREEGLTLLKKKIKELSAAHDVVVRNSKVLLKQIMELEGVKSKERGARGGGGGGVEPSLRENLTLFRLTADALVKTSEGYLHQAKTVQKKWSKDMNHERDLRLKLQENIETMASQMQGLESDAQRSVRERGQRTGSQGSREVTFSHPATTSVDTSKVDRTGESPLPGMVVRETSISSGTVGEREREEDGEDETFFDAEDWAKTTRAEFMESSPSSGQQTPVTDDGPPFNGRSMEEAFSQVSVSFNENVKPTLPVRRTVIPPKPNVSFNLWSFVKNSVGKDLTKLPMPVSINQPLSFLQRMVEDLVYAETINQAVRSKDSLEELTHVAAFACSVYAQTSSNAKITKPFNPLLGETYECDRRAESGWRCIMEQVSHHPPMFAMHVEHKDWTLWEEYTVASKFRGKYVAAYPIGITHLILHHNGNHYTWTKVVSTVHNIVIGNMWIDQSGPMKVVNHKTGEEGLLNFHAYSYFTRERQRKVSGNVKDASGTLRYKIKGYWDEYLEYSRVLEGEGRKAVTEAPKNLWRAIPHRPGSELMYGFSEFACSMNEPEEGVAPTDSRLRPDQRIMEKGDFDTANTEKLRLEEKQRAKRRQREEAAARAAQAAAEGNHKEASKLERVATYSPMWFRKEFDSITNSMMHVYKGGYWEAKNRDWKGVEFPDIF